MTKPSGLMLPVQVIGQQWEFTYRYPTYGGVETAQLVLPAGQEVAFHVTSLDVIHSFWAYELGVKADANPGVDNIAFVKPSKLGRSRSGAPNSAASGTATCSTRAGRHPPASKRGSICNAGGSRRSEVPAGTARPTPPTRPSAPDDYASV